MKTEHTPEAWKTAGCAIYQADDWREGNNQGGRFIASTAPGNPDEMPEEIDFTNAAHIVRCVNSHDRLVAALREIDDMLKGDLPITDAVKQIARDAVAGAEKGQP